MKKQFSCLFYLCSSAVPILDRLNVRLCSLRELYRGFDQTHEERLRAQRPARQFGMRLRADEIRMDILRQFEDLHDRLLGMLAGENHAVLFERGDVSSDRLRSDGGSAGGFAGRCRTVVTRACRA